MTPTPGPLRARAGLLAAVIAVIAAITAISMLAACGAGDDTDRADDETSSATGDDTVVLVTYDSFALPDAAAAAFTERTGATIQVVAAGDAGTMLTRALLAAGAPEGDVIFGIDNTLATRALSEDLLEPFAPDALSEIPDRYLLSGDAGERLVPVDAGDVCMNVDHEWFEQQGSTAPATLDELTEDEYRDLLVVTSPVTSSPGLVFLLGTVDRYGEDGWEQFWQELADNGVRVRPSWDDAYYNDYTVSGGDRPIVLSYASSPPAEVIFSEGARDEPASEVMVDSCAAQVEFAGVLRGAANRELAEELVEFMLSEEWQRELPLTNFVRPVRAVELPEEFARWVPEVDDPMSLAPEVVDARRDEWIERWRDLME